MALYTIKEGVLIMEIVSKMLTGNYSQHNCLNKSTFKGISERLQRTGSVEEPIVEKYCRSPSYIRKHWFGSCRSC